MGDVEKVFALDLREGLIFVIGIILLGVLIISKWDYIIERFGITTKKALKEQEQSDAINKLWEHAGKTDNNFNTLTQSVEEIQECVHDLANQIKVMQEKDDENEAARLKDRIAQAYRYYHQKGEWTSMEKESLESLIAAYTRYSPNSFVHSVVEKELPTWTVIDETD